MESSTVSDIDPSVGGLVWVCRRNGSWWPGRIMSPDEVSESCLTSPRSGTPIKLLGREDASMDWYNLEKTLRVKAFRCGEYDGCIQKAKATAANPNKKKVKYARREDAILRALELETALMDNIGSEQKSSAKVSPSGEEDEHMTNGESDSKEDSGSTHELSQSGISFEDPSHVGISKVEKQRKRRNPNDSEDDGVKRVKHMRGLEDLGTCRGSKRKVDGSLHDSQKRKGVSNVSLVSCEKGTNSSLTKKKPHEMLKRRNHRRRALKRVLESTVMVSVPVICDILPTSNSSFLCGDSKVTEIEPHTPTRSCFLVVNDNSNSNGASLLAPVPEHVCKISFITSKMKENVKSIILGLPKYDTFSKIFDVPFPGEEKHSADFSTEEGLNESVCTGSAAVLLVDDFSPKKESSDWQLKETGNSRHLRMKKRRQDSKNYLAVERKYYMQEPAGSTLYDVNLEVNARYRPQHVPLVSLMSKSDGKAIIGHPLTVEVLNDGSIDDMTSERKHKATKTSCAVMKSHGGKRNQHFSRSKLSKMKKGGGSMCRKIRKLSSLTVDRSEEEQKTVLVKLQSPATDCIPLKVVFGRINEAVNGFARQIHRALC